MSYDNTNTGVIWGVREEKIRGQGKMNINGEEVPAFLVERQIGRDRVEKVLCIQVAVFWENDKEGNEKRPDFRTKIDSPSLPQGWSISGWKNESQNGRKFIGMKIEPPYEKDESSNNDKAPGLDGNPNDEIPF